MTIYLNAGLMPEPKPEACSLPSELRILLSAKHLRPFRLFLQGLILPLHRSESLSKGGGLFAVPLGTDRVGARQPDWAHVGTRCPAVRKKAQYHRSHLVRFRRHRSWLWNDLMNFLWRWLTTIHNVWGLDFLLGVQEGSHEGKENCCKEFCLCGGILHCP